MSEIIIKIACNSRASRKPDIRIRLIFFKIIYNINIYILTQCKNQSNLIPNPISFTRTLTKLLQPPQPTNDKSPTPKSPNAVRMSPSASRPRLSLVSKPRSESAAVATRLAVVESSPSSNHSSRRSLA